MRYIKNKRCLIRLRTVYLRSANAPKRSFYLKAKSFLWRIKTTLEWKTVVCLNLGIIKLRFLVVRRITYSWFQEILMYLYFLFFNTKKNNFKIFAFPLKSSSEFLYYFILNNERKKTSVFCLTNFGRFFRIQTVWKSGNFDYK